MECTPKFRTMDHPAFPPNRGREGFTTRGERGIRRALSSKCLKYGGDNPCSLFVVFASFLFYFLFFSFWFGIFFVLLVFCYLTLILVFGFVLF